MINLSASLLEEDIIHYWNHILYGLWAELYSHQPKSWSYCCETQAEEKLSWNHYQRNFHKCFGSLQLEPLLKEGETKNYGTKNQLIKMVFQPVTQAVRKKKIPVLPTVWLIKKSSFSCIHQAQNSPTYLYQRTNCWLQFAYASLHSYWNLLWPITMGADFKWTNQITHKGRQNAGVSGPWLLLVFDL